MEHLERFETIVIGAGQAGLATGYYLARKGLPFVILDANERVGDAWRKRWDSLRLFTPARFDALPGMPFPAPRHSFPTKDEMADYLESYASRFDLPVCTNARVERVSRQGDRFVVETAESSFEASSVVVAMSSHQVERVPAFAGELDEDIVQLHSTEYRNAAQLRDGPVLIVGAGNSGAEIALEVARSRPTLLAGNDTGHLPIRVESTLARLLLPVLFRGVFHRVLTVNTPMGRMVRRKLQGHGMPLIRVKPHDLEAAGVERGPRVTGVEDGRPVLEDGRVLEVANVIWCTGFRQDYSWLDLPGMEGDEPRHKSGIASEPGLYFVGLWFLHAGSSEMVHGVARDAERIARTIAARARSDKRSTPEPALTQAAPP
jgi:putative flavoprotein involved in K+ transport